VSSGKAFWRFCYDVQFHELDATGCRVSAGRYVFKMSGLLESVCDHIMAKWHRCLPAAGYAIIVESALWRGEVPDGLMHATRSRQSREFLPAEPGTSPEDDDHAD